MKNLNPGSDEALKQGCLCPVIDNAHGKGRYCDGERFGWWMVADCPIHGNDSASHEEEA